MLSVIIWFFIQLPIICDNISLPKQYATFLRHPISSILAISNLLCTNCSPHFAAQFKNHGAGLAFELGGRIEFPVEIEVPRIMHTTPVSDILKFHQIHGDKHVEKTFECLALYLTVSSRLPQNEDNLECKGQVWLMHVPTHANMLPSIDDVVHARKLLLKKLTTEY